MKKYYYVCPRCGRQWVRYIPRSKIKCRFCAEVWHTHGRRGTRSRFSWSATFFWLVVLAAIALAVFKFKSVVDYASNLLKNHSTENQDGPSNKVKVPPIRLRSLEEIENEKKAAAEAEAGLVQSTEENKEPDEAPAEERQEEAPEPER